MFCVVLRSTSYFFTSSDGVANSSAPDAAAGFPHWPKFDATARGYLEFTDEGPVAREGLRRPFCDLYLENVKRLMAAR